MFTRWGEKPKKTSLILGPRRAGKTTFLKSAFPDYAYRTLDDFDDLRSARRDPKGLVESLGLRAIVDEVQRVPELTIALKKLLDDKPSAHVLLTGSSSLGLLDSSADTLAGRIRISDFPTACWGSKQDRQRIPF